ncbi:uncharacterized protein LOC133287495 [Gastrolobium bilobum]|uniref:uncharacterized protein LOC133287495 n=1 Tax=Gastrolobium bilobum TaxID=150636 RepID=UPI002AB1CCDF|nr:uncharacterized protein LOC133287495 [Gastrolobium bilobum]
MAILNSKFETLHPSLDQAKTLPFEYCHGDHETNECNVLMGSEPIQVNGIWYDQRPQQNPQRNQNNNVRNNFNSKWKNQGGLDYKSNQYLQPPPIPQTQPSELERIDIFPSNTIVNPREDCKSIITRSEIVITPQEKPKVVQKKKVDEPVIESEQEKDKVTPATEEPAKKDKEEAKEKDAETPKKQCDFSCFEKPPYPIKSKQQAQKQQHARFLEMFKKLQINIPFAEALANIPNYAKFMKDLLSRKHMLQEFETVALTQECSSIIQKKFPPKFRDPGSFNIPIAIGNINVGRALCDLGESINLMPLSMMKYLKISELKPTMVSLQLADITLRKPN